MEAEKGNDSFYPRKQAIIATRTLSFLKRPLILWDLALTLHLKKDKTLAGKNKQKK